MENENENEYLRVAELIDILKRISDKIGQNNDKIKTGEPYESNNFGTRV